MAVSANLAIRELSWNQRIGQINDPLASLTRLYSTYNYMESVNPDSFSLFDTELAFLFRSLRMYYYVVLCSLVRTSHKRLR